MRLRGSASPARGRWSGDLGPGASGVLRDAHAEAPHRVPVDAALVILDDISGWGTFSPSFRDVRGAIALQQTYGFSFWDAMIVRAAMESGCRTLVSEDMQDGQRIGALTIPNPFAELAG